MFTISQMEQFSGVKTHTIRVWEQRYKALQPTRSIGNTRYYSGDQLRRLLNIVSLKESGKKASVSAICMMSDRDLNKGIEEQLIEKAKASAGGYEYIISQLVAASMSFDEIYFSRLFAKAENDLGLRSAYEKIIYPFVSRVGLLWNISNLSPAHEHFATGIIRQKLMAAIDKIALKKNAKETWLLFLPENEYHEIGLLLANYLIKHSGARVVYLGANISLDVLEQAIFELKPTHLHFFLVHYDAPEFAQDYLKSIHKISHNAEIMLSGNPKLISQLQLFKRMYWLQTVDDLLIKLK